MAAKGAKDLTELNAKHNAAVAAAVAVGVAGVFMETHEDPDRAPSDGPNMVPLRDMPGLLAMLVEFDRVAKRVA